MAEKGQTPEKGETNDKTEGAQSDAKESTKKPSLLEQTTTNYSTRDALHAYFQRAVGISDEPPPESVLEEVTFEGIAKYIASDKCQKIVTMAGAGISTSAGIPDFRSPETGLYHNLQKYDLPNPQAIFDIGYFMERPEAFFTLAKELWPGSFRPTPCHYFLRLLDQKKKLLMHFTQNIDTLERVAGLNEDKIIEAHGTFHTSHCLECGKEYSQDWMKEKVFEEVVPRCETEDCGGLVKPDIVFFGESLPKKFADNIDTLRQCDVLIILGTSLVVHPFASLTSRVKPTTPRLYINLEKTDGGTSDPFTLLLFGGGGFNFDGENNIRDVFWQGTCDDGCYALADLLGWGDELRTLVKEEQAIIDSKIEAEKKSQAHAKKSPTKTSKGHFHINVEDELRKLVKEEHAKIDKAIAAEKKAQAAAKKSPAKSKDATNKKEIAAGNSKSTSSVLLNFHQFVQTKLLIRRKLLPQIPKVQQIKQTKEQPSIK